MSLSIATWNINSVRLRSALVQRFLHEYDPDILCLQEIKCMEDVFPYDDFRALRPHIAVAGYKGYNGVAILSRFPLRETRIHNFCGREDGRHIGAVVELPGQDEIGLCNFYIPAGGDIPDPQLNDKFAHKLDFLAEVTSWTCAPALGLPVKTILVGDFNIAPLECDVWSHRQLLNVVSHTEIEVAALERFQQSQDWVDIVRRCIPPPQKLYTWWSYRARDWRASDRGRRLDHIWFSPSLAACCDADAQVMSDIRGWERPSDHVPVMTRITIRKPAS